MKYLAKTLEIVYKSEEKERLVVPLLTSLFNFMFNVEMLFDNLYFYVDSPTLEDFKIIIDNLMNSPNDRQMFKDVLVRVQYQQSSGLFTSKEQESEQKAQLLKRLAFVIYSSEKDQYQKNMPEIQGISYFW